MMFEIVCMYCFWGGCLACCCIGLCCLRLVVGCDFLRGFIGLFGCGLGCTLFRLGCGFGSCYCWGWVWLLAFMFVGMYCGGWFVWVCDWSLLVGEVLCLYCIGFLGFAVYCWFLAVV